MANMKSRIVSESELISSVGKSLKKCASVRLERKTSQLKDAQNMPTKSNHNFKNGRKSSVNDEIRRVTSKKICSILTKPSPRQKLMPRAPTTGRRCHNGRRYIIKIVGSEIKLLSTKKTKPDVCRGNIVHPVASKGKLFHDRKKKQKRKRSEKSSKKKDADECAVQNSLDSKNSAVMKSAEPEDKQKMKFTDRRVKDDEPAVLLKCTNEEILLERMDPISNIVATEVIDTVKRCHSILDFITESVDSPHSHSIGRKWLFYETTMMEELNFPPLEIPVDGRIPDLKLVPPFCRNDATTSIPTTRSLSWPHCLPDPPRKVLPRRRKKLKFETILSTRPNGHPQAKWLGKTDSALPVKLLQDVITTRVRRSLKRQAELKAKFRREFQSRGKGGEFSE